MARPMATRWRWPPDSAFGLRSNNSVMSRMRAAWSTRLRISSLGNLRSFSPNDMFSNTDICGIERVILEHHRDVAILRRPVVDDFAADIDVAGGDFLEARDHAQRRRLAAAGRTDQHDEFVIRNVEVDAAHDFDVIEALDHVTQRDFGHVRQPFVAPEVRPAM